jgi:hypothetical protein
MKTSVSKAAIKSLRGLTNLLHARQGHRVAAAGAGSWGALRSEVKEEAPAGGRRRGT